MTDFGSRLCGNAERTATPFCRSKTTFAIHAIIPMTIFDFSGQVFLGKPKPGLETNQQDAHPKLNVVFGLCQSVPHLALRLLICRPGLGCFAACVTAPRERIEVKANAPNKLIVGQHLQTRQQENLRIDREINGRVKSEL